MADEKDVAYTITTGYYPEIAGKIGKSVRKGTGTGRVMQRSYKARGFSPTSVQKEEMLAKKRALLALAGQAPAGMIEAEILGLTGGYQHSKAGGPTGKQVGTQMFVKTGHDRDSFKYVGGTEEYKLYGDQVWYMYGSQRKDRIKQYLDNAQMTGPQFLNVFSRKKGDMIAYAEQLAKDVFAQSWDIAKIQKEIKLAGELVAEEIGFEAGGFKYVSVNQAIKDGHKLQASESSQANIRDMVKIDAEGKIVASFDVTEMLITQKGQHGITQEPHDDLIKAIAEIDPDSDKKMEKLRQGVIKMFVAQVDDYNEVIKHFKKKLAPGGLKGNTRQKKWDNMLKKAGKGKKKAGVKDLAKYTVGMPSINAKNKGVILKRPVTIEQFHLMNTHDKDAEQTAIEYIAHMLGTVSEDMNKNFSQTHKVKDIGPPHGSVYAIVPMKTKNNLLFDAAAVDATEIVTGANATIALATKNDEIMADNAVAIATEQNHKFMVAKMAGGSTKAIKGLYHSSVTKSLRNKGLRPSTAVAAPAGPALEKFLQEVLDTAVPDEAFIEEMSKKIHRNTLGLQKNNKTFSKMSSGTMFWALPYLGLMKSKRAEENSK